jgi:hypothetical protein
MSGSKAEIDAITVADCQTAITEAVALEWAAVAQEFEEYASAYRYESITPASASGGELIFESGIPGVLVSIYEDDDSYNFLVKPDSVLFSVAITSGFPQQSSPYESFLYLKHFPEKEYDHEHYSVIVTPNEVGCYDYFTNEITGKYIVGLTDDAPLNGSSEKEYRFQVDKELMPYFSSELIQVRAMR